MSYSAGTAWLQVIPSFRHIQGALERDTRRLAQEIDRGLSRSIPEGMRRGVDHASRGLERDAERIGRRSGDRYGTQFTEQLHRRLRSSLRALPDVQVGVARDAVEQDVREIAAELDHIREQHIRLEIDDDEALRRLGIVRQRMLDLERRTNDRATVVNLRAAGADLDAFDDLVREARRSGAEAGGNFGGAFGRSVREHMIGLAATLPDIPISADRSPFNRELQAVRAEIRRLRDFRIDIDGDADEFFRMVRAVEARIAALRRQDVSIPVNFDLDRATDRLRQFMQQVAPDMGRVGGERTSGRFSDELNNRIGRALRSLPAIEIDADSTPAQREINNIRTQLMSIRDLHIRGELDSTQVMSRLAVLQARLQRLSAQDVDIDVQVNSAAAIVELLALARLMESLDGEMRNVGRSASGSIGRLGALIALALSLGTILVPVAAASAVAIGGIATAAAAAAAGLGVLILGFSGVFQGVTALHKYTQDANKSSKSLLASQNQIASAMDGVANAERSLASTRENASIASARAAKAVRDAQESVTEAVKNRRRAELDLIEAIKEARRQDQDRALSLKENALAQRQNTLDIAEAKKELDAVLNNPRATEAEREQARITYEERLTQMERLKLEGGRLAEEQAESAKNGVMGNKQVVAAQERVLDANKAVRDAEERVAEARQAQAQQARQSADQIAQAQQAVIAAQRTAEQAYVSAGVAGGEALDNLKDAFASLSPEAQRFVRYLYSMKDAAITLRQAAERGMLPGFQQALREIQPYLPAIERFIFKIGETLGWIALQAVRAFQHPAWRQFFGYIDDTAGPALRGLWQATELFARGLGSLIFALSPFNRSMGKGLIEMAQTFATWADKLTSSSGYVKFIDYIKDNGPEVVEFFKELGDFVRRFVIAAAPIGAVVLRVFETLFSVINSIPIPVLSALVALIGLLSIAILANAAANRSLALASSLGQGAAALWARVVSGATGAAAAYTASVSAATAATGRLATAQVVGRIAGGIFMTTMRGIMLMLGGPWGLAIIAATLALGGLFAVLGRADDKAKEMRQSWEQYGQALKGGVTAQSLDAAQQILKQNKGLQDLLKTAKEVGVTQRDLVNGLNGDANARGEVVKRIDEEIARLEQLNSIPAFQDTRSAEEIMANTERIRKLKELRDQFNAVSTAEEKANIAAQYLDASNDNLFRSVDQVRVALGEAPATATQFKDAIAALGAITSETGGKFVGLASIAEKVGQSNLDASEKAGLFDQILRNLGASASSSGVIFDSLAGVFNTIATSALNAKDKSDLLRQAVDQMYGAAIRQTEASESLARTQEELTKQLATNQYGFDLTKAAAQGHTAEVLANRDALQAALQALRDKYVQDVANGEAESVARQRHEDSTKALLDQLPVTQRNSAAVEELVRDYGSIPPVKNTNVSTPGLDQAIIDLVMAHAVQIGLTMKPLWDRNQIIAEADYLLKMINGKAGTIAMYKAEGGPITGYSPNKRADNIGVWATAGEYMHNVDAVDYYGEPFMHAVNTRQFPRQLAHGYAYGGMIAQYGNKIDKRKWPVDIPSPIQINIADYWKRYDQEVQAYYAGLGTLGDVGPGPGFPPWPRSPMAQRGDSGVWRSIVNLIRSTGPLSGSYGNAYRPGDPLWHGSGRAVDWMGYNQDALATFLASKGPLELIHRTRTRDYAFTRGRNRGSFNQTLMNQHANHIHIAMDEGGYLQPGWNPPIWNGTGTVEPVLNPTQWDTMRRYVELEAQRPAAVPRQYNFQFANTTLTPGKLRAMQDRDDVLSRRGRAR